MAKTPLLTDMQVAQAESELEKRWTEKADKMVAQAEEKWKRRFQEVTDEKEEANMKLAELQGKVSIALLVQEIISYASYILFGFW